MASCTGTEVALSIDVRQDDLRENSPEKLDNAVDVCLEELLFVTGVSGEGLSERKPVSPEISSMVETSSGDSGLSLGP